MYYIRPTDPNPISPAKAVLLGTLCLIWLATGLIGHDPWKPDEAYSFGLVYSILQDGNWLIPTLAGEPFMEKPPLFYWTAALFAELFRPLLPLHDGARLASGFYTALTLLLTGLAARRLYGENRGWAAAIILIGCLGLLVRAHQIVTDLALLAGTGMMIYGLTLSRERTWSAGFLMGTGSGIGFLANGLIAPILLIITSALLPLLYDKWRQMDFLRSSIIAILFSLPWLTVWPWLLYQHSPTLFTDWIWTHGLEYWLNFFRNGPSKDAFFYLQNLPWLAWPAWPLAAWVIWKTRTRLSQREDLHLPLVVFCVMFVTLSLSTHIEEVLALPMLLPIVLLATASLSMLKRGAANALDWFGIMTFALITILMWWGWAGLLLENRQAWVPRQFRALQPDFLMEFHPTAFMIAIVATVLWMVMVWRTGRSMRRATLNWASGVTLIWILAMTLWLPWLDSSKSYRGMVTSLKQAMPEQYQCIAGVNLGNGQRAMLHYFGDIITHHDAQRHCDLRLIQGSKLSLPQIGDARWKKIWEGSRKGNKNEYYRLYRRLSR